MILSTKNNRKIMPKIRCPRCEKSNMYYLDNVLHCPECTYRVVLYCAHRKVS